jgi:hypothetical protein
MSQKLTSNSHTPSPPPPPPPQTMSASEASDDHFNECAPDHMPMPDFEALARDIHNRASRRVGASPARRLRHRGSRDGGAGAMGPSLNEVCTGGSGNPRVGPGGRHRRMPVHDGALGDQEGGEGATVTGGGGGSQGWRRTGASWHGCHRWWVWVLLDVLVIRQIP